MSRPIRITDEEVLAHARAVFLERGLRATTSEVAERAGISEALVFKRWGSKRKLFEAAMASPADFGDDWLEGLEARVGEGSFEAHLLELATRGLTFMRRLMPLVTMSFSHMGESHRPHRGEGGPYESRRRLERYFDAERRRGRMRDVDPRIAARLFMGALFSRASWELMLGPHDPDPLDTDAFLQGTVDAIVHGFAPAPRSES